MRKDSHKFLIIFGVVAVLATLSAFLFYSPPPPPAPLPNPNGFDDFVAAGQMVAGNLYEFADFDLETLQQVAATNREALNRTRLGLSRESLVPNNYSKDYIHYLSTNLSSIKSLAWAFCVEGRLAELENRTNDAIRVYLDDIQLGQKCSHGGVIVVRLVGTAIELIGMKALGVLTNVSDLSICREAVSSLNTFDQTEDSSEVTFREEAIWRRQSFGLLGELHHIWIYKTLKTESESLLTRLKETQKQRRSLMISFAARAYELEKGQRPKSISDLVPNYLKAIPQDPFTGTNMTYLP